MQLGQGIAQPWIGEFVTHPTTDGYRNDQATVAQARQVVGQATARDADHVSEISRMRRSTVQRQQQLAPDGVRESAPETAQDVDVSRNCQHSIMIQLCLNSEQRELM